MTREAAKKASALLKNIEDHELSMIALKNNLQYNNTYFQLDYGTGDGLITPACFEKEEIQEMIKNKQEILDRLCKELEEL